MSAHKHQFRLTWQQEVGWFVLCDCGERAEMVQPVVAIPTYIGMPYPVPCTRPHADRWWTPTWWSSSESTGITLTSGGTT